MNHARLFSLCVALLGLLPAVGCVTTGLGQGPTDQDLENDGSVEQQLEMFRTYEVTYDTGTFRRPGADPAAVSEVIHKKVDSVAAVAWSDDAFNYLSSSPRAAEVMEDPAVAFDAFAHSGMGETVLVGTGFGGGLAAGAIAWFINTTVRDGVNDVEMTDLWTTSSTGFFLGGFLGIIVAGAYTYIVPNVSTPFAVPLYRKAARAFNEDLEDRVLAGAPAGDPPPDDVEPGADEAPAAAADEGSDAAAPATPAADEAPAATAPATASPTPIEPRAG
jgi:hypothetical protein